MSSAPPSATPSSTGHWYSNIPWTPIIYGVIAIFLGLVVYKVVYILLNNPTTAAINNILKNAGLLFGDFTQGCCEKQDCAKIASQASCEGACGCGWGPLPAPSPPGTPAPPTQIGCQSINSDPVGQGGWYTPECGFGFLFIIGGSAWLISKVVGWFQGGNKTVEAVAAATSTSVEDISKQVRTAVEAVVEDLREKGKLSTNDEIRLAMEHGLSVKVERVAQQVQDLASQMAEITARANAEQAAAREAFTKEGGTDAEAQDITEEVDHAL